MFAIDTNLLVYAHNTDSKFHKQAAAFVSQVTNEHDQKGQHKICLPTQVLSEFVHVITWQRVEKPLSITEAVRVVRDYRDMGIPIIHQRETQIQTFLELLESSTTRKKVFDIVLAATLKDNGISGLYTVNVDDFKTFDFLEAINPLQPLSDQADLSSTDSESDEM